MSLLVAKLGGSLSGTPQLDRWLAALAAAPTPLIIVPGGGPFARKVRQAQIETGFDDREAHRRALLAMEQFAAVLASRSDRLLLAASRGELKAAIGAGRIPVWLPCAMALAAPEIPASWDATSDSLAAWLAGACAATRLLLIKSVDVAGPVTLRALAAGGIVDPLFPRFAERSGAKIAIAGPSALDCANDVFSTRRPRSGASFVDTRTAISAATETSG